MKMNNDRINRSAVTLDEVFPLQAVIDGCIVSRRGDVTLCWEIGLPEAFTVLGADYDTMNTAFAAAVKMLPPWTFVHRQDIYYMRTWKGQAGGGFLAESYRKHFEGRSYPVHRQYLYLTFSRKSSALAGASSCGLYGRGSTATIPSRDRIVHMEGIASEFISVLTGARHIRARRLTEKDILETEKSPGLLHSYLCLFDANSILSEICREGDGIRIGDSKLWGWSVAEARDIPPVIETDSRVDTLSDSGSEVRLCWASPSGIQMDCPHMVNTVILTVPQREELSEIEGRRRRMGSMSTRSPENKANGEEIDEWSEASSREGLVGVRTHMNLLVWGPEEMERDLKGMASSALARMGIVGVQAIRDTPALWYSCIPGAVSNLGEENLMKAPLGIATAFGMFESYERGVRGGAFRICDRTRHIPVSLDFQGAALEAKLVDNCNAFILGPSGTGKSFFTNFLLRNLYDHGEYIFVIDVGDSYEGLCRVVAEESGRRDGIYYRWDSSNRLSFRLFDGFESWTDCDGRLRKTEDALVFFETVLTAMWEPRDTGWDEERSAILDAMVADFVTSWKDHETVPIFNDFVRFCMEKVKPEMESDAGYCRGGITARASDFRISGFVNAISSFSGSGAYSFLFNGQDTPDLLSSRFTVVELGSISNVPILYKVVILCMMQTFKTRLHDMSGSEFKSLFIDEAWTAISTPTMAPFLRGLWKTARKYNGSAVVVTQEVQDILSNPVIRDTILQNSSTRILLNQQGNDIAFDDLCSLLSLGVRERNLIRSMEKTVSGNWREVFISLGGRRCGVYATEVSPEEAVAYESRFERKKDFITKADEIGAVNAIKWKLSRRIDDE